MHKWGEATLEKYASRPGMGIPDPSDYGDITSLQPGMEAPFVVQLHDAKRAGKHYDVRFGPDKMFSWATKKGLPEPGGKVKLFQTPLHTKSYSDYEGPLYGYGAGTVKQHDKGSVIITSVSPGQVSFVTGHGKYPQRYTLLRDKGNPKTWLAVNTTPTLDRLLPKDFNLEREAYKSRSVADADKLYDPTATFSEKIDGAAALYRLANDRVEALSYRAGKGGRPIIHTERLQLPKGLKVPPHLVGTVLRGEIWGERGAEPGTKTAAISEAISPEELSGVLNSSLALALRKQREKRIQMRNALFDIKYYGKERIDPSVVPYKRRLEMLNEALQYLPQGQFHLPRMATTPEEQRKLLEDIQAGRNPRTHEGVVVWPQTGQPTKLKITPESKVYITGVFPGEGKYKGIGAGGFDYGTTPGGPTVGRVGTGFSDEFRQELLGNPDEYVGRVARIKSQGQFPSGAHRSPVFIAPHEDYAQVKQADIVTPLLPHQQRVADKLRSSNLLVAHGMGSGKSLTSLAAAEKLGDPTTFMTPASLTQNISKEVDKHTAKGLGVPYTVKSMPTAVLRNEQLEPGGTLVVDEAHSLRNPGTQRVKYLKEQAKKFNRIMLLTGTPSYNKVSDIAPLLNLVRGETVLPENPADFDEKYVKRNKVDPGWFKKLFFGMKPGETLSLRNTDKLRSLMRGYVDVHNEPRDFPAKTEEDIKTEMSDEQQDIYDYVEGTMPSYIRWKIRMGLPPNKSEAKSLNSFLTGVRQASNSVYPYRHGMDLATAAEQSPKLSRAVEEIRKRQKEKNFKAFVYTNYMDAAVNPMSALLTKNKIRHGVFHGGLGPREKHELVNQYNTGKLPVLIGTSSASEGVDLKGTKLLQVLEPHFNESKIKQVIARGIRYRSHHHLPEKERNVHVQRFYSTPKQGLLSYVLGKRTGVDEWLHDRAVEKDKVMEQLYSLMKEET